MMTKRIWMAVFVAGALLSGILCLVLNDPKRHLRIVPEAVPSESGFESILHYTYLYDGSKKISRVDEASISPSGAYALFTDGTGKLLLYKKGSGQVKDVTSVSGGVPDLFLWDESILKAAVGYRQVDLDSINRPPVIVHLGEIEK